MHEIDAFGGDQIGDRARVARDVERIGGVVHEPHPLAAQTLQLAVERAVFRRDDHARAGAQQRDRDIDRGARRGSLGQRGKDVQNGRAGQPAHRLRHFGFHHRHDTGPLRTCVSPRVAAKHGHAHGAARNGTVLLPQSSRRARILSLAGHVAPARLDQFMTHSCLNFLNLGTPSDERAIAVRRDEGGGPGLFWLGGFKSDMKGTKAEALSQWARENGRACVRFDYSGHGESGGDFRDGTIGRWLEESLAVFEAHAEGPQVVVGSSMGGWIALLLLRALRQKAASGKAAGLVLIAPAVDFTEVLMWQRFPAKVKKEIEEQGVWLRPSEYGEPYPITRALIEEGRNHLLLGGMIETGCPVRILQGVQDPDVPWNHAVALTSRLAQDDVVLTLVKDGDHRLSRPEDLERLIKAVGEF